MADADADPKRVAAIQEQMREAVARMGGSDGGGYDEKTEHRLTALETRLDTILPTLATKADIGEVRADIREGIIGTQRWMIATVVGLFIGFGGLFLAMSNALKPSPPAPSVTVNTAPATPASAPR